MGSLVEPVGWNRSFERHTAPEHSAGQLSEKMRTLKRRSKKIERTVFEGFFFVSKNISKIAVFRKNGD